MGGLARRGPRFALMGDFAWIVSAPTIRATMLQARRSRIGSLAMSTPAILCASVLILRS